MMSERSGRHDELRVLSVCTHNRTRSVLMGALLAAHLEECGVDAVVATAGTGSEGLPAIDRAVRVLASRGIDVDHHRSRKIDAPLITGADLVITAEQQHVVSIAGRWPAAFSRTFTLPEIVSRAQVVGPRHGRSLDEWLSALGEDRPEALAYLDATDVGDIADPTGHSPLVWDECYARIDALTRRLAEVLV